MSEQVAATSFQTCIEALGHIERRRVLLSLLHDTGDRTVALDRLDADTDDSLRLSLRHNHLPKLEDSGFISIDASRDAVSAGPNFDEIRPLLELLDDNQGRLPDGWV